MTQFLKFLKVQNYHQVRVKKALKIHKKVEESQDLLVSQNILDQRFRIKINLSSKAEKIYL